MFKEESWAKTKEVIILPTHLVYGEPAVFLEPFSLRTVVVGDGLNVEVVC